MVLTGSKNCNAFPLSHLESVHRPDPFVRCSQSKAPWLGLQFKKQQLTDAVISRCMELPGNSTETHQDTIKIHLKYF